MAKAVLPQERRGQVSVFARFYGLSGIVVESLEVDVVEESFASRVKLAENLHLVAGTESEPEDFKRDHE